MNSPWWMGDLTIFKALAGGAFDHLNCQDTGEFQMPRVCKGGGGAEGIDWYISYFCLLLNEER